LAIQPSALRRACPERASDLLLIAHVDSTDASNCERTGRFRNRGFSGQAGHRTPAQPAGARKLAQHLLRQEPEDYVVQNDDILLIRFSA